MAAWSAVGSASLGISTTISIIIEATFDLFSGEFQRGEVSHIMKFKKFGGQINDLLVFLICISIVVLLIASWLSIQYKNYIVLLVLGLSTIFIVILGVISLLSDIHKIYHGDISDIIELGSEGVRFCPVKSKNIFIPWTEIVSITRKRSINIVPRIIIKGIDGSEIWWFENEEAEDYIRKEHPELERLITETGRLR